MGILVDVQGLEKVRNEASQNGASQTTAVEKTITKTK